MALYLGMLIISKIIKLIKYMMTLCWLLESSSCNSFSGAACIIYLKSFCGRKPGRSFLMRVGLVITTIGCCPLNTSQGALSNYYRSLTSRRLATSTPPSLSPCTLALHSSPSSSSHRAPSIRTRYTYKKL